MKVQATGESLLPVLSQGRRQEGPKRTNSPSSLYGPQSQSQMTLHGLIAF